MKNLYIILLTLFTSGTIMFGQEEKNERFLEQFVAPSDSIVLNDVALLFKPKQAGVLIRWAPTNSGTWLKGNEYGYTLEKMVLDSLNPQDFARIGADPFIPWPLADWEAIVNDDQPYRAAAAMTIHGESKVEPGFVKEAEDLENRFGVAILAADLDQGASEASGLRYFDQEMELDRPYIYRIYVNTPEGVAPVDTVYEIYVHKDPLDLGSPQMIEPIESDKVVTIRWKRPTYGRAFTAYYIERSSDGNSFERLNELPYLDISTELTKDLDYIPYRDSLNENGIAYSYRVLGIDPFAELSAPSEVVKAEGRDETILSAPTNLEVAENGDALVLVWDYMQNPKDKDIVGFNVYKSLDADAKFVRVNDELLPSGAVMYTDETPDQRETNYYYVSAVDAAGNEGPSEIAFGFTTDAVPPGPPTGLNASIQQDGGLLLKWDAPADNDIRGYQVLYANSLENDFAAKSGKYLKNTFFVDSITLNTLTEEIFYYVIAIDWSYNQSEPSEIYRLKKPDLIPPEPSIFVNYKVSEEGIYFEWNKSTSDDVVDVQLLRAEGQGTLSVANNFFSDGNSHLDTNVEEGELYTYNLLTIDDDGNETLSEKPLVLEALKSFFIQDVEEATLSCEGNDCRLKWEYQNAEAYDYIIYKANAQGKMVTLKRLTGTTEYVDKVSESTTDFKYGIKAKAKDGRESEIVEVRSRS